MLDPDGSVRIEPLNGQDACLVCNWFASWRYQAAEWLRQMGKGASAFLPKEPFEGEFCLALKNGLILYNVLNKVNPGVVLKVVENPVIAVQSTKGAAQCAIQYFENMRNFLVAVKDMKLLTFEASDLEKENINIYFNFIHDDWRWR